MNRRYELQAVLEGILGSGNVKFPPPATRKMRYDCHLYERTAIDPLHADTAPYRLLDHYQVTVIYKNPDSDLPHRLAMLPMCTHDRHFTADNLNHDIFNLYY